MGELHRRIGDGVTFFAEALDLYEARTRSVESIYTRSVITLPHSCSVEHLS